MNPTGDEVLIDFDPQAVAAQILADQRTPAPSPFPARTGEVPARGMHATDAGLVPDTLSDRGNAKLFVELYARGFRYVPGLGW
ncbi:DNA primase, partial [Streptomyces uncialis]